MNNYDFLRLNWLREHLVRGDEEIVRGNCFAVSLYAAQRLKMRMIEGYFVDKSDGRHEHTWNYDPRSDKYIDLTATQFDPILPKVFVLSRNSTLAQQLYVEKKYY